MTTKSTRPGGKRGRPAASGAAANSEAASEVNASRCAGPEYLETCGLVLRRV